jgi:hypothetical protein
MTFDLPATLRALAVERPIFHSEADFQHALAWQTQIAHPTARIRLEVRPTRGVHLDLLVSTGDETVALELKYLTDGFSGTVRGERFELPRQGAHDISRHDVVKDIVRVEETIASGLATSGWVVTLTNDGGYRRAGTKAEPIDAAFRLHEGRALAGTLGWGPLAGAGTTRKRDTPLALTGNYECRWHPYSQVTNGAGNRIDFSVLAFHVAPSTDR